MSERLLGDLAELTVGHVGSMASEYVEEGIPFLRSLNVQPFRLDLSGVKYISPEFHAKLQKSELSPGDVVVVRTGVPGTAAVVPKDLPVANCSDVVIVRPGPELDSRYLSYLINSAARGYIDSRVVGAVQQHFNVGAARGIPIPAASLDEQRRVAAVLGALDDLIETNRQFAQQVRDLSSTLYAKFAGSARSNVPLGQVASVSDRKIRPGKGSLRYIDIAALGDGYLEFPQPIDWDDAPSRARVGVEDGSTLWSTVRPNRRAHALVVDAPGDLVASTGIAVLTPRGIGPGELFAACDRDEFVDQLVAMADGSAYPAVRPTAFRDIPIRHLGGLASEAFERVMWPLWRDVHAAVEEVSRLTRARDELLPLLMSGKVRTREVA